MYKLSKLKHFGLPVAVLLGALPAALAQNKVNPPAPSTVGGFVYPEPGQLTGPGVIPPQLASVQYLGRQNYGTEVARDLGFSGVVNHQSVWTFGDTLVPDGSGGYQITANDSVGIGDNQNPIRIYDVVTPGGYPSQWIPANAAENANGGLGRYSFGGTNVVEYAPGKGLVWFLKNDRGSGGQGIVGAGVATVTADATGATAVRTSDTTWGSSEVHWGDVGVTYNSRDGDVYVYGYGPDPFGADVYLAKVPASRAADVSAYQYWDQSQQQWTQQRFSLSGAFGTRKLTSQMALFSNRELGQSNPFWSNYYNTWMTVAGANVGYTDIMVMTAPKLEGPWTKPYTVASTCPNNQCSAIRYAITPHPEYDPSGKTLLVTWTDSNVIYAARLTWK